MQEKDYDPRKIAQHPEYLGRQVSNAWFIEADYALYDALHKEVTPGTIDSLARRIQAQEPVMLYSRNNDEQWLRENIADPLRVAAKNSNTLRNVTILGKDEKGGYQLRFSRKDGFTRSQIDLKQGLNLSTYMLMLFRRGINFQTINIISPRDSDFEDVKESVKRYKITTPVKMFHVGIYEDAIEGVLHTGIFGPGTQNALNIYNAQS